MSRFSRCSRLRSSMRYPLIAILLLSVPFADVADAKPPTVEGFVRLAKLRKQLAEKLTELRVAETFASKPFPEQLLMKWDEGATSFGKMKKITAEKVLDQIFDWDELIGSEPTEAANRVIALLPIVMGRKYGQVVRMNRSFKSERYKATKGLVDELVKPPVHVRKLAILSLQAVYSTRRQYVETDPKSTRLKRQKAWEAYIKKIKR
jgi:hypothetical protein